MDLTNVKVRKMSMTGSYLKVLAFDMNSCFDVILVQLKVEFGREQGN